MPAFETLAAILAASSLGDRSAAAAWAGEPVDPPAGAASSLGDRPAAAAWAGEPVDPPAGEDCYWQPITLPARLDVPPYKQCIRAPERGDLLSLHIVRRGRWNDCDRLVELWAETKDVAGGIFLDVGGNIGSCSLPLLSIGAKTVAFEPVPDNLFYFKSSINGNAGFGDRLTLYPIALGDAPGEVEVFSEVKNMGNSMIGQKIADTAQAQAEADAAGSTTFDSTRVRVARLDDVLWPEGAPPPPPIRLMKMDVQGFEPRVLAGAKRLLKAGLVKILKFEVSKHHLEKQDAAGRTVHEIMHELHQNLKGFGYAMTIEGPRHQPELVCRLQE